MTKTKAKSESTVAPFRALFPECEEFFQLPEAIQYQLSCAVPANAWVKSAQQASLTHKLEVEPWTKLEKEAVTRDEMVCPVCNDTQWYSVALRAEGKYEGKTYQILREKKLACHCQRWRHIWEVAQQEIPTMYHYVNLWLLEPNLMSRMSAEKQREELEYLREHRNENFLFCGPAGTGKTTLSCALLRHAFERRAGSKHLWSDKVLSLNYKEDRWIWRGNFNKMYQQFVDKQKEQWGQNIDAPDVTPNKIHKAREAGRRPVLVIEEVDKIELNTKKLNYLFGLIDEILNSEGQLIMTTNLSPADFFKSLISNDENRATAIPMVRRFIQTVNVQNYFDYCASK